MKLLRELTVRTKLVLFLTSLLGTTILLAGDNVSILYLNTGDAATDYATTSFLNFATQLANLSLFGGDNYSLYTANSVGQFNSTAQSLNAKGDHTYGMEHTDSAHPGSVCSAGDPNGRVSASSIDNNPDLKGNSRCGDDGTKKSVSKEFNKIKQKESE